MPGIILIGVALIVAALPAVTAPAVALPAITLPVVSLFFASLHVLLMLVLLVRVSQQRRRSSVGVGDGGDADLLRRIRVHANFVEHVPIALLMLALLEIAGLADVWLYLFGSMLLIGRLLHAVGLSWHSGYSFGRFWGTAITWGLLLAMAAIGIVMALRHMLT